MSQITIRLYINNERMEMDDHIGKVTWSDSSCQAADGRDVVPVNYIVIIHIDEATEEQVENDTIPPPPAPRAIAEAIANHFDEVKIDDIDVMASSDGITFEDKPRWTPLRYYP